MNLDSTVQPAYEVVAALASRHATGNGCQAVATTPRAQRVPSEAPNDAVRPPYAASV